MSEDDPIKATARPWLLVIALAAVVIVGLAGGVLWRFHRPPMPEDWSRVRAGMSHDQVLGAFSGEYRDMRELKDFDLFTVEAKGGGSYWQLFVTYTPSDQIDSAYAKYTDRSFGFLRHTVPLVP